MSGTLNMNWNNIANISDFVNSDSCVVNKKYMDDKTSTVYHRYLHFKSVGRTTVCSQVILGGNPSLFLRVLNTVLTIETIPSETDGKTSSQPSGLLDSTLKV